MRKLYLVSLFCLFTVLGECSQALSQTSSSPDGSASRPEPIVTAQSQLGSPLIISSRTSWLKPEQQTFELHVVVENVSDKPIQAYTTNYGDAYGGQENKRCILHNFPSIGKVLQPGKKDGKSVWRRASDASSQPTIELAVDFVEFTDGSVWGPDTCQSTQQLEGMRAGARAAKVHLKKILQEKGPEKVVVELKERSNELGSPQGHSTIWMEGFRAGVSSFRERISRAFEEGGMPEISVALQRPVDASEHP